MEEMNTKAMYKLSYGLFVCTAVRDGKMNGCIINTAIQVASEPNTLTVAVNKANYTHDMIKDAHTRLIARSIPGAELVLIDGSHFIANEKPEEFNQAVLRFLNDFSL